MKRKLFIILSFVCIMFACTLLCSFQANSIVYAVEENQEEIPEETPDDSANNETLQQIYDDLIKGGYEIAVRTELEDSHLYSALLQIFKDYVRDTYGYSYTGSTLYSTMFRHFTDLEIEEMSIATLNGLEKFKFNELLTLKINNNDLGAIDKKTFENMPKLQNLDLACNGITAVDLSLATTLNKINLSSNEITKVDFGSLTSTNIEINVANNNIAKMTDIVLPTRVESIKLNVINNNIVDISNEYFDYNKLHMNIGVQGIRSADEKIITYNTQTNINYYPTNMSDLELKIYKINTLEDVLVKTITDNSITEGNVINLNDLSVGNYYIEYQKNGNPLYLKGYSDLDYFKQIKFSIIPAGCTFKYEYKNKIYDNFTEKVTGKVKVMMSCEDGAKVYYRVNNGDWQEGNEVMCGDGGNYTITTKVIKDGVESETQTIVIRTSLNTVIPDGVMLILIILFTFGLFFVVVPLLSKKVFKN